MRRLIDPILFQSSYNMNEIDYHKEGEEFEYNGRRFIPIDTCELCDLKDECYNSHYMNCCCSEREDYKYVIYKEVNKRKEAGALLLTIISILFLVACAAVVVSLFLQEQYIFGILFMSCCIFVIVDAWVTGGKS